MNNHGQTMYQLVQKLFPICRSLTGNGFRRTLNEIKAIIPEIQVFEIPSGTQVFDWTIPKEWNIRDAYVETIKGEKVIDFQVNNLHLMGYSTPIDAVISREELLQHIYTLPEQPEWIPYVTSYYKERWGFCISENFKKTLTEEQYHVVIDSTLENGHLTYGELIIPGETDEEILFSTYLCHPSMANNELSGPAVQTELIKYIQSLPRHRYTYRFVFIPETIGSITYLSRNAEYMKQKVKAGFVLSCVGDNRTYSMVESRYANTLADRVLKNILKYHYPEYKTYSFLYRGSDERQYCSPHINLPVCAFCRSKYGMYPEYHTSADDLSVVSPEGLQGAYEVMVKVINALEYNSYYEVTTPCEPQLGKRGLYPTISMKGQYDSITVMTRFLAYADGQNDLIEISNLIKSPIDQIIPHIDKLMEARLVQIKLI